MPEQRRFVQMPYDDTRHSGRFFYVCGTYAMAERVFYRRDELRHDTYRSSSRRRHRAHLHRHRTGKTTGKHTRARYRNSRRPPPTVRNKKQLSVTAPIVPLPGQGLSCPSKPLPPEPLLPKQPPRHTCTSRHSPSATSLHPPHHAVPLPIAKQKRRRPCTLRNKKSRYPTMRDKKPPPLAKQEKPTALQGIKSRYPCRKCGRGIAFCAGESFSCNRNQTGSLPCFNPQQSPEDPADTSSRDPMPHRAARSQDEISNYFFNK